MRVEHRVRVRPFIVLRSTSSYTTTQRLRSPHHSPAGSSQSFSIIESIHIHDPASVVTAHILIPNEWRKWNTKISRCDVAPSSSSDNDAAFCSSCLFGPAEDGGKQQRWLSVGDEMKFYCSMSLLSLASLRDSDIERFTTIIDIVNHVAALDSFKEEGRMGWRILWITTTTMGGLLRAERVTDIVETSDGECE